MQSHSIRTTRPDWGRQGSTVSVRGSGRRNNSLWLISQKPLTEEASKEMPPRSARGNSEAIMAIFFREPSRSTKARRMNFTSFSRTKDRTSCSVFMRIPPCSSHCCFLYRKMFIPLCGCTPKTEGMNAFVHDRSIIQRLLSQRQGCRCTFCAFRCWKRVAKSLPMPYNETVHKPDGRRKVWQRLQESCRQVQGSS